MAQNKLNTINQQSILSCSTGDTSLHDFYIVTWAVRGEDCMHENKNITKPKAGAHSWGKFAFETLLCIKSKSIKDRIK